MNAFAERAEDLATLARLDEQILLEQLKFRYDAGDIYTYIGDILVAVNPFRQLGIYEAEWRKKFRNTPKADAPPHVFAVADRCYQDMITGKKSQCCVISGESGAGKTENAKFMMRHLIYLCHSAQADAAGQKIETGILQVNPLLEAFGNAQTIMNDNSSRFGKYTELQFSPKGAVVGCVISEYLLEKSRVVLQSEAEQNFHVFYYLFASPDLNRFHLDAPETYPYLSNIGGVDEDIDTMYAEIVKAMFDVGFTKDEQDTVFAVLASILHFGHVNFTSEHHDDPCQVDPASADAFAHISDLLELDLVQFRNALIEQTNITRGEIIKRKYTAEEATHSRNAVAKALYGRLFGWLVAQINVLLATAPGTDVASSIGILDIFGFENFKHNSFEQFCINLANEQLQAFFNKHIFELELEEYEREGIDAVNISYVDNGPLLELYLNKPLGLFAFLDEESLFPRATDESLWAKFNTNFAEKHRCYQASPVEDNTFTINHYAGDVRYHTHGFLDKNRDNLAPDLVTCLRDAKLKLVSTLFLHEMTSTGRVTHAATTPKKSGAKGGLPGHAAPGISLSRGGFKNTSNKRAPTVGRQFTLSLKQLVDNMLQCRPHFVRCIKPNTGQSPYNYQDDFVMVQLNYTGMLETTRIRREGYAVRPVYEDFIERFRLLAFSASASLRYDWPTCEKILEAGRIEGALMGRTKVFLKYYHVDQLEQQLALYQRMAILFQSLARGYLARARHAKLVKAAARQREEAARFCDRLETLGMRVSTAVTRLRDYDNKMRDDVEMRKEQARRRAEAEKRAAEEAAAAVEQAERERAVQALKDNMAEMEVQQRQMSEKLAEMQKSRDDSEAAHREKEALVIELETSLRKQEADLMAQLSEHTEQVAQLKQELLEKDADLSAHQVEREAIVRDLTTRVEQGDEAKQAVEDMKGLLRAQEGELGEAKTNCTRLEQRLESQVDLLTTTKEAHDTVLKQLNGLLEQKENITSTVRRELEEVKVLRDRSVRQNEVDTERIAALERQLAERDAYVAELETDLKSHGDLLARVSEEAEKDTTVLREKVESHQRAHNEIQATHDELLREFHKTRQEHSRAIDRHAQLLSDKDKEVARHREQAEAEVEAANARAREHRESATATVLSTDAKLADLQLQIQQYEARLRSVEAEKTTLKDEMEALNSKGEAAAAAQLRTAVGEKQVELEAAHAEIAQLNSRLASQQTLLDLNKTEQGSIVGELKRLLASKEEIGRARAEENEKAIKELEAKNRAAAREADERTQEYEAQVAKLKSEVRRGAQDIQLELSAKDRALRDSQNRLNFTEQQLDTERMRAKSVEARLAESQDEATKLNERLEKQFGVLEATKTAHDQLEVRIAALRSDKNAQALTMQGDYDQMERLLKQEVAELRSEIEIEREGREKDKWTAADMEKANLAAVEQKLAAREREVAELQIQKHRAEQRASELDTAVSQMQASMAQLKSAAHKLEQENTELEVQLQTADRAHEELERRTSQVEMAKMEEIRELKDRMAGSVREEDRVSYHKIEEAIKVFGRRRSPALHPVPKSKAVDLTRFLALILGEGMPVPHEIQLGRFTLKGYLNKQGGAHWQKRWFVFDLQKGILSWYQDKRELRIHLKGSLPLADIQRVQQPTNVKTAAEANGFHILSQKRPYELRGFDGDSTQAWIRVLSAVAARKE